MTKKAFDPVLGRVPSGIFILTVGVGDAGDRHALQLGDAGRVRAADGQRRREARPLRVRLDHRRPAVRAEPGRRVADAPAEALRQRLRAGRRRRSRAWRSRTVPAACRSSKTRSATSNANRSATSTPATTASSWPTSSAASSTTPTPSRWSTSARAGRSTDESLLRCSHVNQS